MRTWILKASKNIVLWLAIFFLGFLSVVSLFSTAYFTRESSFAERPAYRFDLVPVNLLVLLLFFLAVWWFHRKFGLERLNTKWLAAVAVLFVTVLSLIWVEVSYTYPEADQKAVSWVSYLMSQNNFLFFEHGKYMQVYPNQLGLSAILEGLYRISGGENWKLFMYLTAFSNGSVVYLLYKISHQLFADKKIDHLVLLLSMGCAQIILYTTFLYGITLGLALALGAFYAILLFLEKGNWLHGILAAVLIGASVLVKNNYSIVLVALVLLLFYKALEQKKVIPAVLAMVLVLMTGLMSRGLTAFYEQRSGLEIGSGMPKSLWVAMGMQEGERAEGWYNAFNFDTFVGTDCDPVESDRLAKEAIRESLKTFREDPAYAARFYYRKTVSQWNEPTYEALWVNQFHSGDFSKIVQSIYDGKLYQVLHEYMNLYQSLILTATFILLFFGRKKLRLEQLFLALVILGGFFFHTLWEAKSQYIFPYFVMLLPYGAAGLNRALEDLLMIKKEEKKCMKWKLTQRESLLAALLSLPATAIFSWLVMRVLYQKFPQYEEFVTGYTSWTAYYKSGDMTLAYLVIGGVLVFYVLFAVLLKALSKKMGFLQGDLDRAKEAGWKNAEKWGRLKNICFLWIFTAFSIAAVFKTVEMLFPGSTVTIELLFHICEIAQALYVGIFGYFYLRGGKVKKMNQYLYFGQLFLPLSFLWIARYEYLRDGVVITQYDSAAMKGLMLVAALLLIGYNVYQGVRRKGVESGKIYLSSFLSLAVFASYTLPRGTISGTPLEMYHYGEISGPLHQFLQFGTVPYIDTMPIHGVCDYFQAGVWYTLFDGTYASLEPAMIIGCVIIALITAVIYYYYVEDKFLALLCILLFSLFGDKYYYVRWAFALPFILIVFSGRVRNRFDRLLWNWTFISILSIAWNPSIGGACALAALPMVLWEGIHEKGWKVFLTLKEKEGRKKILPWYLPLLILGISYIPMFFAILRYIVENSAAILETTGDILREELVTPFVWYATFGFAFSLLAACYFFVGKKGEDRKLAGYALAFLILFNGIIVKYTFVRTQFGERGIIVTTICSLFLILMIFLPYLKKHRSGSTLVIAAFLFFCTVISKGSNLLTMPGKVFDREEIPAEYVYAPVEETGIEGLGDIYITEVQKNELMSLNELANEICKDYQFVDMTNQLSHYNIVNKKVLLPFSSTYNTNNKVMQTKAIEVLEELKPEVIVVSPEWKHDSGALSTRNYYLYQYLAKNYVPCKYKELVFLTNQEELFAQYGPAYEEFGKLMHVERLKAIPALWGNEYLQENETEKKELVFSLVDTNTQETGENTYQMTAEENYFMYTFEENISGRDAQFLRISVEDLSGSAEPLKFEGVVYFMREGQTLKESHRFIYDGKEGDLLIPLSTSPYWSYADDIQTLLVDFIGGSLPGKKLSVQLAFETLKK